MDLFQVRDYLTDGQNNPSWKDETNFYALKILQVFLFSFYLGDSNWFLQKKTKNFTCEDMGSWNK